MFCPPIFKLGEYPGFRTKGENELNNNPMHQQQFQGQSLMDDDIRSQCQMYMNYHVMAQMSDGSQFDGIIESMDNDGITMLVAEEIDPDHIWQANEGYETRQFNFGYGGYGHPHRRRFRRFHRRRFPFNFFRFIFPFAYFPLF